MYARMSPSGGATTVVEDPLGAIAGGEEDGGGARGLEKPPGLIAGWHEHAGLSGSAKEEGALEGEDDMGLHELDFSRSYERCSRWKHVWAETQESQRCAKNTR